MSGFLDKIAVNVVANYEPFISDATKQDYFFSYRVTIINDSDIAIQVVYRYWNIFDIAVGSRRIEGLGVVGEQPIIKPHTEYSYSSFCFLGYPMGYMRGNYDIISMYDNKKCKVDIPIFFLVAPYLLN